MNMLPVQMVVNTMVNTSVDTFLEVMPTPITKEHLLVFAQGLLEDMSQVGMFTDQNGQVDTDALMLTLEKGLPMRPT